MTHDAVGRAIACTYGERSERGETIKTCKNHGIDRVVIRAAQREGVASGDQIEVIQAVCRDKAKPCMKVERTKTHVLIDANYEARTHVMANVDAVVVFGNNRVEIPIPGAP